MTESYPKLFTMITTMITKRALLPVSGELRLDKVPGWALVHELKEWSISVHKGTSTYLMEHNHTDNHHTDNHHYLTSYAGQCYACKDWAPKEMRVQFAILRMGQK